MFLRIYSNARVSERVCWHLSALSAIDVLFPGLSIQQQRTCQFRSHFLVWQGFSLTSNSQ